MFLVTVLSVNKHIFIEANFETNTVKVGCSLCLLQKSLRPRRLSEMGFQKNVFSKSNIKKTIYLVAMGEGLLPGSEWKNFFGQRGSLKL